MEAVPKPVDMPKNETRAESNGVATNMRVSAAIQQVVTDKPDAIAQLGNILTNILSEGNSSGGSGGGEAHVKQGKKQNYIAIALMLLSGAGGGIGGYYALKAQAATNTHEVRHLKTIEPRVKQNERDIQLIKVDVSAINSGMGDLGAQQTHIVDGINALKQEKVDKLTSDLANAERELRRLRSNN